MMKTIDNRLEKMYGSLGYGADTRETAEAIYKDIVGLVGEERELDEFRALWNGYATEEARLLLEVHNRAIRTALTKLKQYFNMKQN